MPIAQLPTVKRWKRRSFFALATLLCTPALALAPQNANTPTRLGYALETGKTYRYQVSGIFSGHIPPFAQSDGPPIHLRAELEYLANVKRAAGNATDGAEVEFTVAKSRVSLLEKEPGADGKIDPESEIEFPLPLSEVQKTLNVTARVRPDGSVVDVKSPGGQSNVRLDLGIDLRKLFLLMMPVTFPDQAIKPGDTWTFNDGLLGQRPGKVTYNGKLLNIKSERQGLVYRIENTAASEVDDKKTKEGKPTDEAAEAVETTTGTAKVNGTLTFFAPKTTTGDRRLGRLSEGTLTLNALLKRKAPSLEDPMKTQESNIDVKARLTVKAADAGK